MQRIATAASVPGEVLYIFFEDLAPPTFFTTSPLNLASTPSGGLTNGQALCAMQNTAVYGNGVPVCPCSPVRWTRAEWGESCSEEYCAIQYSTCTETCLFRTSSECNIRALNATYTKNEIIAVLTSLGINRSTSCSTVRTGYVTDIMYYPQEFTMAIDGDTCYAAGSSRRLATMDPDQVFILPRGDENRRYILYPCHPPPSPPAPPPSPPPSPPTKLSPHTPSCPQDSVCVSADDTPGMPPSRHRASQ